MGVETGSKTRKGSTPGASTLHRPTPPKRAHTSAVSVTTISSAAKKNATAANANQERKLKTPLLTPQLQRAQRSGTNAPKTPSPNYFGLVVEEDAANYGINSDAGRHAKQNWSYQEREVPLEEDPRLESFRKQSDTNNFKFGQAGHTLTRISTDGRVPTLRSLTDANVSDSSPDRHPMSAGGRLTSQLESSEEDEMEVDHEPEQVNGTSGHLIGDAPSFFDMQISSSPVPSSRPILRHPLSSTDARHPHGSLPQTRVTTPVTSGAAIKPRSDTLPASIDTDAPKLINVAELQKLLALDTNHNILLLDLRVSPQYAMGRIRGALNLCIPTTLLKRPAFNVQKLADTFNAEEDKAKFSRWQEASHIIVYDAASLQLKDATSSVNTLKKFRTEGYKGKICIIQGGFNVVSRQRPDLVHKPGSGLSSRRPGMTLSIGGQPTGSPPNGSLQVAGGCQMPSSQDQPANPFFGNIRQNMDLIDGVGQMEIKRPSHLSQNNLRGLPTWLRDVVDEDDAGKAVSDRFLKIERAEQTRMQRALSTKVEYGTPMPRAKLDSDAKDGKVQVAGIEKGTKNRYKDMLPFEHSRVHLKHTYSDSCDYINASHVSPAWSNRHYIAAQAPIPATFRDFWRVIWEQDVRVIVMLTAETENGQMKCHRYWTPDTYGDFKIKQLSEKKVGLELPSPPSFLDPSRKASMPLSQLHNQRSFQRRATLALNPEDTDRPTMPGSEKEPPFCILRKFTISNVQQPFAPMREISQIMYTSWPDLGAPAEASELLGLVEEVGRVVRGSNAGGNASKPDQPTPNTLRRANEEASKLPAADGERPVLVHCSAGCGRTGTFVTVDSVCDMLRRQRMVAVNRRAPITNPKIRVGVPSSNSRDAEINPMDMAMSQSSSAQMDVDNPDSDEDDHDDDNDDDDKDLNDQGWVQRDDIDLIEKTVTELRTQRISMVQNLRQFTLCYESVLEWLVREMPERFRRENFRKSFQG